MIKHHGKVWFPRAMVLSLGWFPVRWFPVHWFPVYDEVWFSRAMVLKLGWFPVVAFLCIGFLCMAKFGYRALVLILVCR